LWEKAEVAEVGSNAVAVEEEEELEALTVVEEVVASRLGMQTLQRKSVQRAAEQVVSSFGNCLLNDFSSPQASVAKIHPAALHDAKWEQHAVTQGRLVVKRVVGGCTLASVALTMQQLWSGMKKGSCYHRVVELLAEGRAHCHHG
jgi:hypothetical protein